MRNSLLAVCYIFIFYIYMFGGVEVLSIFFLFLMEVAKNDNQINGAQIFSLSFTLLFMFFACMILYLINRGQPRGLNQIYHFQICIIHLICQHCSLRFN